MSQEDRQALQQAEGRELRASLLRAPSGGEGRSRLHPSPSRAAVARVSCQLTRRHSACVDESFRRRQTEPASIVVVDVRTRVPVPYSRKGDGAFRIVPHPSAGHVLVANFDIPKGYKTVFWGTRRRWRDVKEGEDYAMTFRSNGGVIDPTTHKVGSQMQFMSCPGPNERMNMRSTNEFFGATYEKGLVGREFVVTEDIPKNHQLLIWYGAQWFDAREIKRMDVGTKRYPATLKKNAPGAKRAAPLGDATNKTVATGAKKIRA